MRNLLQNKAVVIGLCAVAGLCVVANFVRLPRQAAVAAAARSLSPETIEPLSENWSVPAPLLDGDRFKDWRNLFPLAGLARDPFAPATVPVTAASATNTPPGGISFTLQAVSIEPHRRLAVLNQRVVAAGDILGHYRVESIHPAEVHLRGPFGPVVVSLRHTNRVVIEKSALGTPGSADLSARPAPANPGANAR